MNNLGAQQRTLVAMILRETGSLVLLGMIVGGGLSVLAIRLISARLYGLAASDVAAGVPRGACRSAGCAAVRMTRAAFRVDRAEGCPCPLLSSAYSVRRTSIGLTEAARCAGT